MDDNVVPCINCDHGHDWTPFGDLAPWEACPTSTRTSTKWSWRSIIVKKKDLADALLLFESCVNSTKGYVMMVRTDSMYGDVHGAFEKYYQYRGVRVSPSSPYLKK